MIEYGKIKALIDDNQSEMVYMHDCKIVALRDVKGDLDQ